MPKDYAAMRAAILRDLDGLRYEVDTDKHVGRLILDRPPLNVVSYRGRSQIAAIIEAFGVDPDVRVIVIRGANGVYSSGGDVKAFPAIETDGMSLVLCHYPFRSWRGMGKGWVNLHGHSHGRLKPLPRQFDVGVDVWGFRPVTLSEILHSRR